MKAAWSLPLALALSLLANMAYGFRPDEFAIDVSPASASLSQQTVNKIFEDRNGYIWLLTQEGLNRFDGYDVTSFTASRSNPTSLSHQITTDIAEDSTGRLWISTLGGGLNRFNAADLSFSSFKSGSAVERTKPLSNLISSLHSGSDGLLWVGYANGAGFSRFDTNTETFTHFFLPNQMPNTAVKGFLEAANDVLLIAVAGHGIYKMKTDSEEISQISGNEVEGPENAPINPSELVQLASGKVLVTSFDEGAFILDLESDDFEPHPIHNATDASTARELFTSIEDQEGNHWFGTTSGVAVYSPTGTVTWLSEFNSNLPDDQVVSILESEVGMVWFGTFNGLAQGTKSLFQRFNAEDGLPNSSINAIATDDAGTWWLGTEQGIVRVQAHLDNENDWQWTETPKSILQDHTIMSIAFGINRIWAGTLRSGFFEINQSEQTVKHYLASDESEGLAADGIPVIRPISENKVLVGTYGGGLNIYDPDERSFTHLMNDDSIQSTISDDRVLCILVDSDFRIWVGTQNGLNLFDIEDYSFKRFKYDPNDETTLSSGTVLSLAEDLSGNIWIGTRSGGLNVLRAKEISKERPTFQQPSISAELPSADIYGILVDDEDNIWVSHNAGISRINKTRKTVVNFDETSGLQGSEFNHGAAYKSRNGSFFFGGQNGFNVIDTTMDFQDFYEPKIQITSIMLLNRQVYFDEPYSDIAAIDLNYDYQFASLSFAALDHRRPNNILYRYRIEGVHDEWINLGRNRQISISGLPHGRYILRLSATNSARVWSNNERILAFNIAPPLWLTWYAFFAYALALTLAVYIWIMRSRARTRRDLEQRLELEQRVRERTFDLQEARNQAEAAAEAKAAFLAAMSHEIRTPMHGMLGMTDLLLESGLTRQQRSFALTAKESGQSLLGIINSILDYSKLDAGKLAITKHKFNVVSLLDNLTSLLVESASKKNTQLLIVWTRCDEQNLIGDEGKVRQVLINLIGNAIKFTANGKVMVRASVTKEDGKTDQTAKNVNCSFQVSDTGIGIPNDKLESIFETFTQGDTSTTRKYGGTGLGLAISKELSELMGGDLSVESEINTGSTFSFMLPMNYDSSTERGVDLNRMDCFVQTDDDALYESVASKLKLLNITPRKVYSKDNLSQCADKSCVVFIDESSTNRPIWAEMPAYVKPVILSGFNARVTDDGYAIRVLPPYTISDLHEALSTEEHESFAESASSSCEFESLSPQHAPSILLVEDVEVNQRIATSMLASLGVYAEVANNGREALHLLEKREYDAILMDCQMPELDGYETTVKIRSLERSKNLKRTPVIALTAGGDVAEQQRAFDSGMDDYVLKPFTRSDLRKALTHIETTEVSSTRRLDGAVYTAPCVGADVLDMDVIENLRALLSGGDTALASDLLAGFNLQFDASFKRLSCAVAEEDREELRKSAHAIKSMSANMGAKCVRSIADTIEQASEFYSFSGATPDLEKLQTEKDTFVYHYETAFDIH
jgi:signal transduction histidine kinase/ligand-binding sensor domain-containing protein/DNA-binding response OmpR family regulator